jgi:hypothetical protein
MEEEKKEPMEEQQAEPKEEPKAEAVEQPQQAAPTQERPTFLTVLCILSFIGSGLSSLLFLIAVIAAGAIMDFMASLPGMSELSTGGSGFFLVSFLLALGSLFGAILMWNLKKIGFYLYAAANIVAIFVPLMFTTGDIGWLGLVITVVFIILYGLNFKYME